MLKLIGAVTCGTVAAATVAYYAMRSPDKRSSDAQQIKSTFSSTATAFKSSAKRYFSELFSSTPAAPPANA